jgi:hypothetical protein
MACACEYRAKRPQCRLFVWFVYLTACQVCRACAMSCRATLVLAHAPAGFLFVVLLLKLLRLHRLQGTTSNMSHANDIQRAARVHIDCAWRPYPCPVSPMSMFAPRDDEWVYLRHALTDISLYPLLVAPCLSSDPHLRPRRWQVQRGWWSLDGRAMLFVGDG